VLRCDVWFGGGTDRAGSVPAGYSGSGCGVLAPAHAGVGRVALVGSLRVALLLDEPMMQHPAFTYGLGNCLTTPCQSTKDETNADMDRMSAELAWNDEQVSL
jgi:hypothetical protein